MTAPRLALVVEGHAEVEAVPVLVRRLAAAAQPTPPFDVLRPIRVHRSRVVKPGELERAVELAVRKLAPSRGGVLVLLDADDDCAADFAPELWRRAVAVRPAVPTRLVLAVREFESWFLAAAESVSGHRALQPDLTAPDNPEGVRDAKGWLQERRTDGRSYSPVLDQPKLAALLDLGLARARSASFDKLCRDVEALLADLLS